MNITQENVSDLHLKIKVNITPEDYLPKVETGIKEAARKMQMPGFRPGKVPASLTRKMYGNSVLADEIDKMLNELITNYIKEKELSIFGQPLPYDTGIRNIDINTPESYEFGFEVGLVPPFESVKVDGRTFNSEIAEVTDEMVQEELDKIQLRFGKEVEVEAVEDEMTVILGQFDETENGEVKPGGISNKTSFAFKVIKDEEVKEKVKGLKKDGFIDINMNDTFGHDHDLIIHNLLNTDHAKADSMNPIFRLTVLGYRRIEKTELNAELFDKAFGPGKVNSVEELKEKVRAQLEKEFNRIANIRIENAIHKAIIDETVIPFPEDFLKKWIQANNKEEKQSDITDEDFKMVINRLKWDLIVDKLVKEYNIEIKIEDIRQAVKKDIAEKYFGGEADENMNDLVERLADSILKEEKSVRRYTETALYDRVFAEIMKRITINKVVIPYHDFVHQDH